MPTNEQIYSLYEVRPQDWDDMSVTPIDMNAVVGAKKTLTLNFPAAPLYFGFRPTTAFDYDTQIVEGVLKLYLYPAGVGGASAVELASIDLEDDAAVGQRYMVKVTNIPASGSYQAHAKAPIANCVPGDKLVAYILTRATGGGYIAGAWLPVLFIQYRGESFVAQTKWNDRTPVSTGIASAP